MRNCFSICLMISAICSGAWSQTAPAAKTAPAKKPAATAAAKPAAAAPAEPTAIIDTTAGKMTCTLFPDKAPLGVANFVGLAQGTKDWTNPVSHAKKHGVPLYDGTIFHRVIPNFMIQGGDPAGTGSGDVGFEFKNETSPTLKFDRPGRLAYANAGPGKHYYRVLETDQDGKSIYSKVVSATLTGGDFSVAVLNNPAKGSTDAQLQINAGGAGTAFIELWTLDGRRMSLQQEAVGTGTTTIAVPTSGLPAGSYVVKVMVGGNVHVAQVVKL